MRVYEDGDRNVTSNFEFEFLFGSVTCKSGKDRLFSMYYLGILLPRKY